MVHSIQQIFSKWSVSKKANFQAIFSFHSFAGTFTLYKIQDKSENVDERSSRFKARYELTIILKIFPLLHLWWLQGSLCFISCQKWIFYPRWLNNNALIRPGSCFVSWTICSVRTPWAQVRKQFFSSGVNKRSLDCIEKAAFFVTLDDQEEGMMGEDPSVNLDRYAKSLLHGKCYDRWDCIIT